MTLNQLLYFETIAETGSLRQAARKLYIAQPSLSVSMMKLEQELKVELFVHQSRRAELTEAGVQFLGHVKKIMKETREDAPVTDHRGTFNGWGNAPNNIVIDQIFYRNATPMLYQTLDSNQYGRWLISDHYPIKGVFVR